MESKNEKIKELVRSYCEKHLDNAYLAICTKVLDSLLQKDETVYKRGNPEIWAAAIVWAVGSENFLSDKSFEPYATLSDVCAFFNANTSTVGQKSRKIKDLLKINLWNPEYRLPGSKLGGFLDSLVMTDNGFIVPGDMFDEDEDDSEIEIDEEDATPEYYLLVLKPVKKVPAAFYYQLEYQLKKMLASDEQYVTSGRKNHGVFTFLFLGWWDSVEKIQNFVNGHTDFVIIDIYYDQSVEALIDFDV